MLSATDLAVFPTATMHTVAIHWLGDLAPAVSNPSQICCPPDKGRPNIAQKIFNRGRPSRP